MCSDYDASGYFSELRDQLDLYSGCKCINDVDFKQLNDMYPIINETTASMQDIIKTYLKRLNEFVGNEEDSFASNLSALLHRYDFPPFSMLSDFENFHDNVIENLLKSLDSEFDCIIQKELFDLGLTDVEPPF